MRLEDIIQRFDGVTGGGNGDYTCRCPAHDDKTASLTIGKGSNGIVVCCHAGCATADVLRAVGLGYKDLYDEPKVYNVNKSFGKQEAIYSYTDENGKELFQVVRFRKDDGKKTFRQRVRMGDKWDWHTQGIRKPLYRLPKVLAAKQAGQTIYLVEGEKDVETIERLGLAGTTNAGGASDIKAKSKWLKEHTDTLAGAKVCIIPDIDDVGRGDRSKIARLLIAAGCEVTLCDLRKTGKELPPKGDISDFAAKYGDGEARKAIAEYSEKADDGSIEALVYDGETLPAAAIADESKDAELKKAVELFRALPGYGIKDGKICATKDGENFSALCTFIALPTKELLLDDGENVSRSVRLRGWSASGRTFPEVDVPMESYGRMAWVAKNWGMAANISPGSATADKLRYAITEVGNEYAVREKKYVHTGWRKLNGKWCYLMPGSSVGAETEIAELDGDGMKRYKFDGGAEDKIGAAIADISAMSVLSQRLAVPLWAFTYLAPLRDALQRAGALPAFGLYLVGESGSGKSVAAALALSHFGDFDGLTFPASFEDTFAGILKSAFTLKDCLFCIDDLYPETNPIARKQKEAILQRLSRSFGNISGRRGLNPDGSMRMTNTPRSLVVMTAEYVPPMGVSGQARFFISEVTKTDVPKNDALTEAQLSAQNGLLAQSMRGYIESLAGKMDELPEKLGKRFRKLRTLAQGEPGLHARAPSAIAHLMIGYEMMTEYFTEVGALGAELANAMNDEAWQVLLGEAREQGSSAREERPDRRFMHILSELISSRAVGLKDLSSEVPVEPGAKVMIGYKDWQYIYLLPDLAYKTVCMEARQAGAEFELTKRALFRQMELDGFIACGNGTQTRVKTIDGKSIRLLWVLKAAMDGSLDNAEQVTLESFIPVKDEEIPF